jgi:hypothetical protein
MKFLEKDIKGTNENQSIVVALLSFSKLVFL